MTAYGVNYGFNGKFLMYLVFTVFLIAISLIDCKKNIISGKLLLASALNRGIWAFLRGEFNGEILRNTAFSCMIPLALLILVLVMDKVRNRETMGGGDIKLLFVMALYLSGEELLLALLSACILAVMPVLIMGKKGKDTIPFGPFLSAGCIAVMYFGTPVIKWYMNFV